MPASSNPIQRLSQWLQMRPSSKAQSLVELALVLPILILMLLGVAEVSLFMGRYLDVLDLTREASRLASLNDPFITVASPTQNCSEVDHPESIPFFYRTACTFSPPPPPNSHCDDANFCNGFNRFIDFDLGRDDVIISIYTVVNDTVEGKTDQVTGASKGYWALSSHANESDTTLIANENWKRDCQGNAVASPSPYYTPSVVQGLITNTNAAMSAITPPSASDTYTPPANKGFVAVEAYYCYHQVLGIPIITNFVPNPVRIHAYTLMPLAAGQATRVPPTATTAP